MKEILSKKRKLEDCETIALMEGCNAIIDRKLLPKLKDPGTLHILCTIGEYQFGKALRDLGASINIMPFLVFKKLELVEGKETSVTLFYRVSFIKEK